LISHDVSSSFFFIVSMTWFWLSLHGIQLKYRAKSLRLIVHTAMCTHAESC
jgi:hypothetical protein